MTERITATLPVDGLLFWKLEGEEALSEAFTLQVTLLSTDARIERHALLGQPITLSIPVLGLLATRYLNGKITRIKVHSEELNGTRYAVYSLTMEPDLWPMKRDRNLRIFQNQTVPQIIKSLLQEYNVTIEDKLSGNYRLWEYCVQYQESSFNFISRLMELEGIYYFFRHQQDQHAMVLMDTVSQHQPVPGYEFIPYHVTASGGVTSEEGVSQWALEDHVTPGIYSLDDYDFRQPNAWLFQARQNPVSPVPGEIDVYDWPGHFVEHQHGENYARIRQQVWQAGHQKISGSGTALGIAPGHTFLLHNAPWLSDNGEYLTIKAEYQFAENRYASGSDNLSEKRITFSVIPADCPFRAPPKSPWPKTCGPQTAKVVGPQGESIWTDKYGRIKVKFHWDRQAKGDDSSSCWVRVSSAWAGQGFGGVQIPRVNDEVVIDFINGDPDRPMVIGRVYNEASMPPWSLPAAATQMGFISRSKDGTPDNANALRFEDKAGAEQVWVQAERNMDTHIKHDASNHIGSNHSHFVGASEQRRVAENQMQAVKGTRELLTGKAKLDAVVDEHVLASGRLLRLECGKSAIELTAAGNINLVGTGFNIFVEGNGQITTSGGELALNVAGSISAINAPGDGHRDLILQAVEEKFLPEKEQKSRKPSLRGNQVHKKLTSDKVNSIIVASDNEIFHKISAVVFKNEGGYVNDPNDSGGATNKGISWKTWRKFAKEDLDLEPTLDNLKKISNEQAEIIYKKRYWDAGGFDKIQNPKLALMSYDWTITSGGAGKKIQKLLNEEFNQNLSLDGVIGPKTIQAMNSVGDSSILTSRITDIRKEYYRELAVNETKNVKFLTGWLNRVDNCSEVILE